MDPVLMAAIFGGVAVIFIRSQISLKNHHREWVCVHEGKRVHMIADRDVCILKVDGVDVLRERIESTHRFVRIGINGRIRRVFKFDISKKSDAFGECLVQIQSDGWGMAGENEISLKMDGKLIPMFELNSFSQNKRIETYSMLEKSNPVQIQDPRWKDAEKLIHKTRTVLKNDTEGISALNRLTAELQKRMKLADKLNDAKMTGLAETDTSQEIASKLENEIDSCLKNLQRLHLIGIEKGHQAIGSENMNEIEDIIGMLEAESFVEKSISSSKDKAKLSRIQKSLK